MKTLVIYKSKYGSTKQYAEWIAEELDCEAVDAKSVKPLDLEKYDIVPIYISKERTWYTGEMLKDIDNYEYISNDEFDDLEMLKNMAEE